MIPKKIVWQILIFILILNIFYVLWLLGLNSLYSFLFSKLLNFFLLPFSQITSEIVEGATGFDLKMTFSDSEFVTPLEPVTFSFIILLSWVIFLVLKYPVKASLLKGLKNIGLIISLQLLLIGLCFVAIKIEFFRPVVTTLLNSFNLIAVIIIVKDILIIKNIEKMDLTKKKITN